MKKNETEKLVLSGLMVTLGLLIPYFTSHMFGIPGTILLPMHLPILLCGLLCGPKYGALVGAVVPILSSLLTGMPPVYPMLPIMTVQLILLGLVSGLFMVKTKKAWLASVAGIIAGWVGYALVLTALIAIANGKGPSLTVVGAITAGLPGLILQIISAPLIVQLLTRFTKISEEASEAIVISDDKELIQEAEHLIKADKASCVLIRNHQIIYSEKGQGISPLMKIYLEQPELLKGTLVVDKIIGKAAAVILVMGQVKRAHGITLSRSAAEYLEKEQIDCSYRRCVGVIENRSRTGICPIEQSVLEIEQAEMALELLIQRLESMNQAG